MSTVLQTTSSVPRYLHAVSSSSSPSLPRSPIIIHPRSLIPSDPKLLLTILLIPYQRISRGLACATTPVGSSSPLVDSHTERNIRRACSRQSLKALLWYASRVLQWPTPSHSPAPTFSMGKCVVSQSSASWCRSSILPPKQTMSSSALNHFAVV